MLGVERKVERSVLGISLLHAWCDILPREDVVRHTAIIPGSLLGEVGHKLIIRHLGTLILQLIVARRILEGDGHLVTVFHSAARQEDIHVAVAAKLDRENILRLTILRQGDTVVGQKERSALSILLYQALDVGIKAEVNAAIVVLERGTGNICLDKLYVVNVEVAGIVDIERGEILLLQRSCIGMLRSVIGLLGCLRAIIEETGVVLIVTFVET